MKQFVVTALDNPDRFTARESVGGADTYSVDFSPWAEDNSALTGATWTVESGTATVTGQALASNVASALVSFPQAGSVLLKLTPATSGAVPLTWVQIAVRDPQAAAVKDHGYY